MTSTTNIDAMLKNNDDPPPILVKYSHMRREWDRLCSFTSDFQTVNQINCPHIRPDSLARSGFFYSGISDGCTCFVCGVTLSKWEPLDTPEGEHEKHVPNCPFLLNGGQLCGNLPLPAKNGSTASSSSSSSNTTTTLKNDENNNENSKNSKNNDTTNSASYNSMSARDLFGDDEEEIDYHEDDGFGLFGDDDDYVPTKKSSVSTTAQLTTKNEEEEEEQEKTEEAKDGKAEAAAAETKKEVIKDARVKQMFISDLLFSLLQAEMNEHLGVDSSKSPVMTPTTADSNVSFSQSIFDT